MAVKSTFRPIRRSDGPCNLMAVTFCALFYYGEEPAAEAAMPQRTRPPVDKPFFAVTAFRFTGSILAQQSANSDHFWQVCVPLGARKGHRCANSNPKRALPKEPKRAIGWREKARNIGKYGIGSTAQMAASRRDLPCWRWDCGR
jgi:hypothetical protein